MIQKSVNVSHLHLFFITLIFFSCFSSVTSTRFADLPNEIICEIFEYLDAYYIYTAFLNLNTRFQNLLFNSNFPFRIDMFLSSNASFHRYYTQFLLLNLHRIHSLRLLNSFPMALAILLLQNISKFSRLHYLLLDQIELVYLENLLLALFTSPRLSSLNIIYNGPDTAKTNIYYLIFQLPLLKYCKITFKTGFQADLSPACDNKYSPIKYLYLNGECKVKILLSILSYTPQLRYLSIDTLHPDTPDEIEKFSVLLSNLTNASIHLGRIQSHQFLPFITKHFPNIRVLHLSMSSDRSDVYEWKPLILSHIPDLRISIRHN